MFDHAATTYSLEPTANIIGVIRRSLRVFVSLRSTPARLMNYETKCQQQYAPDLSRVQTINSKLRLTRPASDSTER